MFVDMMKETTPHHPHYILELEVETRNTFRHLGVSTSQDFSEDTTGQEDRAAL